MHSHRFAGYCLSTSSSLFHHVPQTRFGFLGSGVGGFYPIFKTGRSRFNGFFRTRSSTFFQFLEGRIVGFKCFCIFALADDFQTGNYIILFDGIHYVLASNYFAKNSVCAV